MQQSASWGANRFLDSQEIPRILWNPKGFKSACHVYLSLATRIWQENT